MKKFPSRFPYGFAGWAAVQTILTIKGTFDPLGAALSLSLILVVIVGTEHLAWWVANRLEKKGKKS